MSERAGSAASSTTKEKDVERRKARKAQEFLNDFIEEHRIAVGDRTQLVVTDEECMELGKFFLRGIVGWALSYDLMRGRQYSNSPLAGIEVEEGVLEEGGDADSEGETGKSVPLIH